MKTYKVDIYYVNQQLTIEVEACSEEYAEAEVRGLYKDCNILSINEV